MKKQNGQTVTYCLIPLGVIAALDTMEREVEKKMELLRFYCICSQLKHLYQSQNFDNAASKIKRGKFDYGDIEEKDFARQFAAFGVYYRRESERPKRERDWESVGNPIDPFAARTNRYHASPHISTQGKDAWEYFCHIGKKAIALTGNRLQTAVDIRAIKVGGWELSWGELCVYFALQSITAKQDAPRASIVRRAQIIIRAKGYPNKASLPPDASTMHLQNASRIAKNLARRGIIFCQRITRRNTAYGSPLHTTRPQFLQHCQEMEDAERYDREHSTQ